VKVEIAVVRGKKLYDKRETEKRKEAVREAAVAMKQR
jgi:tmRNA-binding protein